MVWLKLALLSVLLSCSNLAVAGQVRVAVAANFTAPMKQIAKAFQHETGHHARISYGSTGKLYAQIINGAPFEVFLAADQVRPALLYKDGLSNQPQTYAIGTLALWSADSELSKLGEQALTSRKVKRIAIANPKTAPYGAAAIQILQKLKLATKLQDKLVRGENIAQTYQFVYTQNAQLGFIAGSQAAKLPPGSYWQPPQNMYEAIHQDFVWLNAAKANPAAKAFVDFLTSEKAQHIIQGFNYALP